MLSLEPTRIFLKKILSGMIFILKKYFGSEIVLEVPEELQDINKTLFKARVITSKINLGGPFAIKKILKAPDEPFIYQYYFTLYGKNSNSNGADFFSEERAYWKSLAEGIERSIWKYSNEFYKKKLKKASFLQLGDNALDINSLAGFSDSQKRDYPFLLYNEKSVFKWIRVPSLTSGRKIFCPIQLFSLYYCERRVNYFKNSNLKEPMLRWAISTGLATGRNKDEAVLKGILEVIERDSFMITYLNKISPPQFNLEELSEEDDELKSILKKFKRYNLEIHILKMPTDFPIHITLSVLIDRSGKGPALTLGARADFDLRKSIIDAMSESLSCRLGVKDFSKIALEKIIDMKKMDRIGRLIYWSRIENIYQLDFLIKGKVVSANLSKCKNFFTVKNNPLSEKYCKKKIQFLTNIMRKKKYDMVYADITTKEIKKFNLHCVVVVIPQLQPMHLDERIPYFEGKRLREVPTVCGYSPAKELNKIPHPFP